MSYELDQIVEKDGTSMKIKVPGDIGTAMGVPGTVVDGVFTSNKKEDGITEVDAVPVPEGAAAPQTGGKRRRKGSKKGSKKGGAGSGSKSLYGGKKSKKRGGSKLSIGGRKSRKGSKKH